MGGAWPTRAIFACCALLAFAAPAHASTQIGMAAPSDPDNCTPNNEWMQKDVGSTPGLTPSYDVPTGGGVITSWSTTSADGSGHGAQLKVYRPTADPATWTVVGVSTTRALTGGTLNSFSTRIPVQAGDRIAVRTALSGGGPCDFPYDSGHLNTLGSGYDIWVFSPPPPGGFNPPVGTDVAFTDDGEEKL